MSEELWRKLEEAEQKALVPSDLKEQGWVYRDIPGRLSLGMWDLFLSILGEGNYQILVLSQGPDWIRGQFLLSPKALENMKAYRESHS